MNTTAAAKSLLASSIVTLGLGFAGLCAAEKSQLTLTYRDLAVTTSQDAKMLYKRIRHRAPPPGLLMSGTFASR
jgi:hypothetical protein